MACRAREGGPARFGSAPAKSEVQGGAAAHIREDECELPIGEFDRTDVQMDAERIGPELQTP